MSLVKKVGSPVPSEVLCLLVVLFFFLQSKDFQASVDTRLQDLGYYTPAVALTHFKWVLLICQPRYEDFNSDIEASKIETIEIN